MAYPKTIWVVRYPGSDELTAFASKAVAMSSIRFSCWRLPTEEATAEIESAVIVELPLHEQTTHL